MTKDTDAERRAKLNECARWAHKWLVALINQRAGFTIGSGTLLRAGDKPVVLTALHVVEDPRDLAELRLLYFGDPQLTITPTSILVPKPGTGQLSRAALARTPFADPITIDSFAAQARRPPRSPEHDPDLDVALVEVRPDFHEMLLALEPPAVEDAVAFAESPDVGSSDVLCAVGLPYDLALRRESARAIDLVSLIYFSGSRPGCRGEGHLSRGIHFDWNRVEDMGGRTLNPVYPAGVSGGALWQLSGGKQMAVWHPSKFARIVGVASSKWPPGEEVAPECERYESFRDWGSWLRHAAAEVAAGRSSENC